MKSCFAIGIPTLNRSDLLNSALEIYFKNLPDVKIFIIDNGDQDIKSRTNNFKIIKSKENLGVARSWNKLCLEIFKKHEYALILNDDIQLDIPQEQLNEFIKNKKFDLIRCNKKFHLSSFVLTKDCFNESKFDEEFYPAYFEDLDYMYRLNLLGKKIVEHSFLNPTTFVNSGTISEDGGDPSINKNYYELQNLYIKKWGGPPTKELFITPYNKNLQTNKIVNIIAVTYDHGYKLKCFIDSVRSQTADNWRLHIIHDGEGELYDSTKKDLIKNGYLDHPNIVFSATKDRHNDYGHSLRKLGLKNPAFDSDYTVITNCDNYYVPEWLSFLNILIHDDCDFITWDCVHDHPGNPAFDRLNPYGLCKSQLKEGSIDMGAVAIKSEIAQRVGFNYSNFNGDWEYFYECLTLCRKDKIQKLPCILFVHN